MSVLVLDLPQVWQKPAFQDLLEALQRLRVEPLIWNAKVSHAELMKKQESSTQYCREVTGYLSTIVKSELAWITDEDDKETIWNEASQRFSERCGRAGMGDMTRRWPFDSDEYESFELVIKEPAITGDNIGLKTWGSSYLLAQMLYSIRSTSLSHLLAPQKDVAGPPVLELGSGTGLLGIAASAIWQTHVILSDLPEIMPNLVHNADQNRKIVQDKGGSLDSGVLTWGGEDGENDTFLFAKKNQFEIIIAADCVYDDDHPKLLAGAVDDQLSLGNRARAMVMIPKRDDVTARLISTLLNEMAAKTTPLVCLEETVVTGQDDWGEEDDDKAGQVKCWLGIFGRRKPVLGA